MAGNSVALMNAYNYYLTTYAPKSSGAYDTHKKSELRGIYNSIVKMSKDAPLFFLHDTREACRFAVGIKENARQLHHTIAALGGVDDAELLRKKIAYSTDESIASVSYIGDGSSSPEAPVYEIEVQSLASCQVNLGNFLPEGKAELAPGAYSFDVAISNMNYEFQYVVHAGETNREIQERLTRLVNNADIGIQADVMEDSRGNSSLRLRSDATGLPEDGQEVFSVSDEHTSKLSGSVAYFGIDYISREASDAQFLLNGEDYTSASNSFTLSGMYSIRLNGVSGMGETAVVGLKTDVESLTDNIGTLIGGYNSFIRSAEEYMNVFNRSKRLSGELGNAALTHKDSLDALGLNLEQDGTIRPDYDVLQRKLETSDIRESLAPLKDFANSLLRKVNQIAINPMDYVDKTVVAYRNPVKSFPNPYITSAYSGMMFNSYC